MGNVRYANGNLRRKVRAWVLATFDVCAICGQPVDKSLPAGDPWSAEVDEILPVSRGGSPYDRSNLQLAHRCCNLRKSNHLPGNQPVQSLPLPLSRDWRQ